MENLGIDIIDPKSINSLDEVNDIYEKLCSEEVHVALQM